MKTIKNIAIFLLGIFLFSSCEDYLEKTPDADVTIQDIFGTYESFQGFIDPNYGEVIDYNAVYLTTTNNIGGETYQPYTYWSSAAYSWVGNYWELSGMTDHAFNDHTSLYANVDYGTYGKFENGGGGGGMWTGGWRGIRVCNVALENLPLLSDATDEEKRLIEGQIYFFRAYFHNQIIDAFGGMPYVDKILSQLEPEDMELDRLTYHESTEKIVEDYDRAIALLPVNWATDTEVGRQRPEAIQGRITKGAAMAYKAKVLLYAASPLMNHKSIKDPIGDTYNKDYTERAAIALWEVIELANTGVYELTPWDERENMFIRKDGYRPWTKETIFQRVDAGAYKGSSLFSHFTGRKFAPPAFGGKKCEQVNQLYVDKFEMTDGTRYKLEYDNNNARRWDDRDPRFKRAILVDRDVHGTDVENVTLKLWNGAGSIRNTAGTILLPYLVKKFWPAGVNKWDLEWGGFTAICPKMRLADIYLFYAEAVTEAYGPTATAPGANLTAVAAVNMVRERAQMPPVTEAADGYDNFMELIRNERAVELCFEGHFWYDTRRWHTAHESMMQCVDLNFDKKWTNFSRAIVTTKIFEDPKYYWFPIRRDQTFIYPGMYQNPGWE